MVEEFKMDLEEIIQLEHSFIAQVIDFKEDEHNFYLIEEYC